MKRIIREQWGMWCLALSLLWAGLVCVLFPAQEDLRIGMKEQADAFTRVQVAYRPELEAAGETLFPTGRAEDYRNEGVGVWAPLPKVPTPPPRLEEPPTRASIKPVVLLLPDPGPSLEGADRLPAECTKSLPLSRLEFQPGREKK